MNDLGKIKIIANGHGPLLYHNLDTEQPAMRDTTVQGIAFAAGLSIGLWDDYSQLIGQRSIEKVFESNSNFNYIQYIQDNYNTWLRAVERGKNWEQ